MENISHDIRIVSMELIDPHNNRAPVTEFANIRELIGDERYERGLKEHTQAAIHGMEQIRLHRQLMKSSAARSKAASPARPDEMASWRLYRPKSLLEWLFG